MDAERLLSDDRVDRKLLESGAMDAETFANRLGALELQVSATDARQGLRRRSLPTVLDWMAALANLASVC